MIEVEIRGQLSKERFDELTNFFAKNAELLETQDREMILLRQVPGYSHSPTERVNDVRLRCTNGETEVMIKTKASEHNTARTELSIPLTRTTLDQAKELARAFGCTEGQWMHRRKKVYDYQSVHWSLVEAPPHIYYFEAERIAKTKDEIPVVEHALHDAAVALQLPVFTPVELQEFIALLGREVNKDITW